jgi:DNA repair protein RadD
MLRDYQRQALNAIWDNLDRHVAASLPTGSGKGHIIAELGRKALQEYPGTRVLVLAHVRELLEQNAEKIRLHWPEAPVGIYCAGLKSRQVDAITVASIQSVYDLGDKLGVFDLIIVDEAHRIPHGDSGMYHTLFRSQPEAKIVGLTATPYRLGGGLIHQGDDALFDALVCEILTGDLVAQGHLSPIRSRPGSEQADLDGVHTRAGEFVADEMNAAFDQDHLTTTVVQDILKHAAGRTSIMVFCCSVDHCHHVAAALLKAGEASVRVVTGETPSTARAETIAAFKAKSCRVLVNCDVLTTGFDAPNTDCIVLLRATKSPGLYVQIIGRGLRKADGKTDCLLLDYGGNVERHGPIDSITAKRVEANGQPPPMKTCPSCGSHILAFARVCPDCGNAFDIANPREPWHGREASTADPLAPTVARLRVLGARYVRHRKAGKPDSLRVIYDTIPEDANTRLLKLLQGREVSEWVCFEHPGFARTRAADWAWRRGVTPAPKSVTEALHCSFATPSFITVRQAGKYPEVIHHEFTNP